jgi:hypothetical protein
MVLQLLLAFSVLGQVRTVRHSDLPFDVAGGPARFAQLVDSIERSTAERVARGENEHLVYFILQSQVFTRLPRIEPGASAGEFVARLEPAGRARFLEAGILPEANPPEAVAARIRDFMRALGRPSSDERIRYFKTLPVCRAPSERGLGAEYARAMRFLFLKDFTGTGPDPLLYRSRGHSTDTQVDANFALWTGLAVLKATHPETRIERVLIIGPGMDFAPRTEFFDFLPPQSYQPYAVADALIGLGLSAPDRLRIHCVDINPRVVDFLNGFARREDRKLVLLSRTADPDFADYFADLGRHIGAEIGGRHYGLPLEKTIAVRQDVARSIDAALLNIITQRYDPSPAFDLAIATNVLIYLNDSELALALTNVAAMLAPGGCFMHNELTTAVEAYGREAGLDVVQARVLRLGRSTDSFVIQRKVR